MLKIVFTGGGTGGHVFPIKSLIEYILENYDQHNKSSKIKVFWIGEKNSLEQKIAKEINNIEFYSILSGKIRRYWSLSSFLLNLLDLFKLIIGFFQSIYFLYKNKIDIIFCKGGYVAIPVVLAGFFLKKKIYVHESDTIPGLTNKIASKFSKKVFWGFSKGKSEEVNPFKNNEDKEINKFLQLLENSYKVLGGDKKVISVGQILSKELVAGLKQVYISSNNLSEKLNILVIGGSQGAKVIFDILLSIAKKNYYKFEKRKINIMLDERFNFFIVLGLKNIGYKHNFAGFENVKVFDFVDQKKMGELLYLSDRSITRGGATSLAEQDLFGVKKIIIPLPFTAHNHQYWNGLRYKIFRNDILLKQDENLEKNLENILINGNLQKKQNIELNDIVSKIDFSKNVIIKSIIG